MPAKTHKPVATHRHTEQSYAAEEDAVALEEPLEIRVDDEVFAVTLRSPGDDQELVAGLLWAEGLIRGRGDLGSISHCGRTDDAGYGNVIEVVSAPGKVIALEETTRRGTLISSACGVCGRRSIDDLCKRTRPVRSARTLSASQVSDFVGALRAHQSAFAVTGGVHAAGLYLGDELVVVREDIGRHNAVDKVFGRMLLDDRVPLKDTVLVVSGRAGFEIVQKACVAEVPFVISVSAPSSMAVDLAEAVGITLVGFARNGSFRVYCHPERLV
ncbi:MAG TPA: formate dehydrogenase accessory sulfurtransferase FdhD [Polyangiaceae bacterium]|nr:formate dehydrogenase accessory sulfurtransferase FdhD [Polyangiaceae bacterium]HMR78871.1 formate dehydrogenase accessory sulfurtransferase FdhD [Polyangiaceae bacterium]